MTTRHCPVDGKRCFRTFTAAKRAIRDLIRKRRNQTLDALHYMRAYKCRHCSQWHIGHKAKENPS